MFPLQSNSLLYNLGFAISLLCSFHDSKSQNQAHHVLETKPFAGKEELDKLSCCAECTANYEKEAGLSKSSQHKLLPSWLQTHGAEARQKAINLKLFL